MSVGRVPPVRRCDHRDSRCTEAITGIRTTWKVMKIRTIRALAVCLCALPLATHAQERSSEEDLDSLLGSDWSVSPANEAGGDERPNESTNASGNGRAGEEEAGQRSDESMEVELIPVGRDSEPSPEMPARRPSSRLIEEIVVTAQKREENLQDVPIMINAFSGDKLDAFGVESTADLQKITPGLTYTYSYGYSVIFIRGVRKFWILIFPDTLNVKCPNDVPKCEML